VITLLSVFLRKAINILRKMATNHLEVEELVSIAEFGIDCDRLRKVAECVFKGRTKKSRVCDYDRKVNNNYTTGSQRSSNRAADRKEAVQELLGMLEAVNLLDYKRSNEDQSWASFRDREHSQRTASCTMFSLLETGTPFSSLPWTGQEEFLSQMRRRGFCLR